MSYLRTAAPTPTINVVHTATGKTWLRGEHYPKSRVWLLDTQELVLCVPGPNGGVERITDRVVVSEWQARNKLLLAVLANDDGDFRLDAKGCGCNMGVVGNAGPVEGRYNIARVRTPEWHEVKP